MTDRERIEGLIADLQNRIAPALRSQNAPGMARSVNEAADELRRVAFALEIARLRAKAGARPDADYRAGYADALAAAQDACQRQTKLWIPKTSSHRRLTEFAEVLSDLPVPGRGT